MCFAESEGTNLWTIEAEAPILTKHLFVVLRRRRDFLEMRGTYRNEHLEKAWAEVSGRAVAP